MQTIGEYKEYTRQLEGEVGKWHHAYDALVVERNMLVNRLLKYEKTVSIRNEDGAESVALLRETFEAISGELEELRKHEVEWDMAKARIKELESEVKKWREAFDSSEVMNRKLVAENRELKESNTRLAIKNKILQKSHDATTQQLQDLLDEFNKNIDESEINQLKTR